MRKVIVTFAFTLATAGVASADEYYKWTDEEGNVHIGDSIPAEFAERPKEVVNEHGVTIEHLEGKKTEEQLAAEREAAALAAAQELQLRADRTLLATYLTVEEILMHRDRRVELFKAQTKVTELYLNNLRRRLESLRSDASGFSPYSENPDAPMISDELAADLRNTRETIERHERNLERYQEDEKQIILRFEGDIARFKRLKGID